MGYVTRRRPAMHASAQRTERDRTLAEAHDSSIGAVFIVVWEL